MTLIVNEIHYDPADAAKSRIVCAADRRISISGTPVRDQQKQFTVDRLNLTASYFGLAETGKGRFDEIVQSFVRSNKSAAIGDFAKSLAGHMNAVVSPALLSANPSGFHVCGFNDKGVPEMWFTTNIKGMQGYSYVGFRDHYEAPSEELSTVHLTSLFDNVTGLYNSAFAFSFQNGDLRPFRPAWYLLDGFAAAMDAIGLTRIPTTPSEHEARVKWKMQTIALFYENISYERIIGGPIDIVTLLPNV